MNVRRRSSAPARQCTELRLGFAVICSRDWIMSASPASSVAADDGSQHRSSLRRFLRMGRSPSPAKHRRRHSEGGLGRLFSRSRSPSPEKLAAAPTESDSGEDDANSVTPNSAFQEESDSEDEEPLDPSLVANTSANKGLVSVVRHLQEQAGLISPTSPTARKAKKGETLAMQIDKPVFQRNRCTIAIRHGDPVAAAAQAKRQRSYFVATDTSSESQFALEWCVGTVMRATDVCYTVSVVENEDKLDDEKDSPETKQIKQRERLHRAQAIQRQVVSLLERTKLHVTVVVQCIHASNARHMLIDTIDFIEVRRSGLRVPDARSSLHWSSLAVVA